jgi:hypothetical protein
MADSRRDVTVEQERAKLALCVEAFARAVRAFLDG